MRRMLQGPLNAGRDFDDLIETGTLTSNTATVDVRFNNASYDSYEIRLNKIVPNQDDAIIFVRASVSAGFTFATDANYLYNAAFMASGGVGNSATSGLSFIAVGRGSGGYDIGNAAGENANYVFYISSPNVATEHTEIRWDGAYVPSAVFNDIVVWGAGRYAATLAMTAIRFFLNSGNFQRGTYEVIGHRNNV